MSFATATARKISRSESSNNQCLLGMPVLHEYAIAAYFAYFSKVSISHIFFRINMHFRRQFQYSMFH